MMKMVDKSAAALAIGACAVVSVCMGAEDWPTYHGQTSLAGVSATAVPAKLSERWRTRVGQRSDWPAVVGSGLVFVDGGAGRIAALDMTGKQKWLATLIPEGTNVADSVSAPFACDGGMLVVAGKSGIVYALSAADGGITWQHRASKRIQGTLNISRQGAAGQVLVLALLQESGQVLAIDPVDGKQVWESKATARCDGHMAVDEFYLAFGSCSAGFHILSTVDGELVKFIPAGAGCEMAGGTVIQGDQVFAGNRSGSLVAASIAGGDVLWVNEDGKGEMFTTPAVSSNRVVFCTGDCSIMCLDRKKGTKVWEYQTDGTEPVSPVIAGDKVIAVSDGSLLLLSLDTGAKLWSRDVADQLHSPAVVDGTVIVVSDDGVVVMFGATEESGSLD